MTSLKKKYLDRIRSDSAYPAFRVVVNIIALLMYVLGAIMVIMPLVTLFYSQVSLPGGNAATAVFAMAIGVVVIILGKVLREASLMLADVADSITDLNSRNEGFDHLGKTAQASEVAAANSQASADLLRQLIRAYGHEPEA